MSAPARTPRWNVVSSSSPSNTTSSLGVPERSQDPATRTRTRSAGLRTADHFFGESGPDAYWSLARTLRHLRELPPGTSEFMTTVVVIAAIILVPIAALSGRLWEVPASGWKYIVLLALLTGTMAHGLLASNTLITVGSAFGFVTASKNWKLYVAVAILTATMSLVIGTLFLFGEGSLLPAFFGG